MRKSTALIVLMLATLALTANPLAASSKPNIIIILTDDLGWKDVGYAGAEFFETPNIDRLASDGMTFTAAYSGGPNCSPSRACLMTGTYTPRHHIYTPGGFSKGNPAYMRLLVRSRNRDENKTLNRLAAKQFKVTNQLDPAFQCIPEVLKQAGYTTARLGKWHLGKDHQGFDLSSAGGNTGPDEQLYGDADVAEHLTDRAVRFIEENREGPFFLYLSHWDVHIPLNARSNVVGRYKEKLRNIPEADRQNFKPVYAAMIEAVDTSVGRVVAKVEELGLAEDTLIIFTSDNGGLNYVSQLGPLRGQKGSLFEAGVRVSACMRWDGVIQPGSTCDTPITSVDYMPTAAFLAGAGLPDSQPVDGVNLFPLLRGEPIAERSIYWHYPLYLASQRSNDDLAIQIPGGKTYYWRAVPATSMRRGDWKLFEYHEDNSVRLYNLKDDPGEKHDLSESMPEVTARLRADMDAWQAATGAPIPTEPNPDCVLP